MSIGKLLASRNARTARFDVARASGSRPGLPTHELVSGALARCPHKLGASILECVHSPEAGDPRQVEHDVMALLVRERARRAERITSAEIVWHLAVLADGRTPRTQRAALRSLEEARADRWPNFNARRYAGIVTGVFHELWEKHLCQDCGGRGQLLAGKLMKVCSTCRGTGKAQLSEGARASMCGIHRQSFVEHWAPVYNWLLCRLHSEIKLAEEFIREYCRGRAD